MSWWWGVRGEWGWGAELMFRTRAAGGGPGGQRFRLSTPADSQGPSRWERHWLHSLLIPQSPKGLSLSLLNPSPWVSPFEHGNQSLPWAVPQGQWSRPASTFPPTLLHRHILLCCVGLPPVTVSVPGPPAVPDKGLSFEEMWTPWVPTPSSWLRPPSLCRTFTQGLRLFLHCVKDVQH